MTLLETPPPPIQIEIVNVYQAAPAEPAGLGIRIVAFTVDCIIGLIAATIFQFALGAILGTNYVVERPNFRSYYSGIEGWNSFGLAFLTWGLYSAGCESSPWQATPGKRICRIVVQGIDGNRIDFGRAFLRYAAKYLSWIFLIGYLMVLMTPDRIALHDALAKTRVVFGRRG